MRLPFGFGRRSGSGDGASDGGSNAGSGAAGGSTSGSAATGRPAAAPSRAWASLPPIQRTAGDMPLVAAPARFARALPGTQALPPIVQPLGHEVSSLATPGLVVARARPVEVASSQAMPAPVQRRAARGSRSGAVPVPAGGPDAFAEAVEPAAPHAPAVAAPDVAAPPAAPPIRSLPTVSRLTIRMPDRPLTTAASAARPAAVQRAAAAAGAGASAALPAASGGMRRVPAASSSLQPTVSREAAAPAAAPAARESLAAERAPARHGVGEPLPGVPASARPISAASPAPIVSRSTMAGPIPVAASRLPSPVQRAATATTGAGRHPDSSVGSPRPSAASEAGPPLPELPHLPVARSTSVVRAAAAASSPAARAASTSAESATSTTPATPAPEIRPIAGANPIRPAIALQRSAGEQEDDAPDEPMLPSPWWSPAPEPGLPQGFGSRDGGPPTAIQRLPAGIGAPPAFASPTVVSDRTGQALGPASTRATVQRAVSQTVATRMPLRSAPREAGRDSIGAAAAGGDSTVGVVVPAGLGRVLGGEPAVQTSPARPMNAAVQVAAPPGLGSSTIQRAEDSVSISMPEPPRPSSSGSSQSGARSERDLDELAQALFGRIRGRLRNDLIHDREAKGLTFDNV